MIRLLVISLFITFGFTSSLEAQLLQRTIIGGRHYLGKLDQHGFCVTRQAKDTVLNLPDADFVNVKFKDFNKDGFKDIFLEWGGNILERYSLYIFIPSTKKFRGLKNFSEFPSPSNIAGTSYYYSYARGGCADLAWNSRLFYIKNFTTVKVGHIHGDGCGINDGIFIYRNTELKEKLIKTLPLNTIERFKNKKFGFIKTYWGNNHKQFI